MIRLIKIHVSETYDRDHVGRFLSYVFTIHWGLNTRRCTIAFTFQLYCTVEYDIRRVQKNRICLELNVSNPLLFYVDDVKMIAENSQTIRENIEILLKTNKGRV